MLVSSSSSPRRRAASARRALAAIVVLSTVLAGAATARAFTPVYNGIAPAQPSLAARANATATVLTDGRILVAGGDSVGAFNSGLRSAEIYDPRADSWQAVAPLGTERSAATAARLKDGRVLVAGGADAMANSLATGEVYDPPANTWTAVDPAHPLGAGRTDAGSALLPNGDVLIVGGSVDGSSNGLANTDLFDPTTNQFTAGPPLSVGRAVPAVVALPDGKVLVAGGSDASGKPLDSAEVYDPRSGSWAAVSNALSVPRVAAAAAALPGRRVLVAGGLSSLSPESADASSDIYDEATNRFTPGPAMSTRRALFTLTALGNGQLLAAGGADVVAGAPVALATTELYDDTRGAWSSGPLLSAGRFEHVAVPTPDGGAAIIGGLDAGGAATPSVDRYVPALAPSAPGSPSAAAFSGAALITWAPSFDGGSPITRYVVTASPGGAAQTITNGATGTIFTGLRNGTTYTFTVTATNQIGTSPPATSNAVTPTAPALTPSPGTPPPVLPRLKLTGVPHHISLGALSRGIRFTVTPNTAQALAAELVGATTTATLARAAAYDIVLARANRGSSSRAQQFDLRVPARLIGHARRFTLRLIVTGTDHAHASVTISATLTVAPAGPSHARR